MRNYLQYAGANSRDFGVYISGQGTFDAPEREYEFYTVPGRDGELAGSSTRLKNKDLRYPAFIFRDFDRNLAAWRNFLLHLTGYHKLSDSYHPDEYRLALYTGPFEPEVRESNREGQFEIAFNVQPQRWLLSGDSISAFTADGLLTNPTLWPSQPLLRVYGVGELGLGDQAITITAADEYTDIDCRAMDSYKGDENRNSFVEFSGIDYPVLQPGVNRITLGAGVSRVEIKPRWWRV